MDRNYDSVSGFALKVGNAPSYRCFHKKSIRFKKSTAQKLATLDGKGKTTILLNEQDH
jgi:hypothetical protein